MCKKILFILFACTSFGSQASETDILGEAMNNISSEYAVCAAFFMIVHQATDDAKIPDLSEKYKVAMTAASEYALIASTKDRSHEMATKLTVSRIEMNYKDMAKQIDFNYSNIAILLNKHLDYCADALENYESFMNLQLKNTYQKYGRTPPKID